MIFFASLFQSTLAHDGSSTLRALWHDIMERLCQRYKLTLSLAACLCLGSSSIHAHAPALTVGANQSAAAGAFVSPYISPTDTASDPTQTSIYPRQQSNAQNDATPTRQEPSLYALLDAEFAADRDDKRRALILYKQQSFRADATAVFERALGLSLQLDKVGESLQFAKSWQDQNPDHVPAWFYVAHLALRAHEYLLAGETLNRILRYDPRADLSEILIGIYPNDDKNKRELLAALQPLDSEQNASLSVLKAGLLYQFDEPEAAIIHIDRALERRPDYVPFIILKADILRRIVSADTVIHYISQARLRNLDSKNLYLYEIRYRLDLQQSQAAWALLLKAHERFRDDAEIALLAALVGLDIEHYERADQLLKILAKNPAYLDQAYYYLGISAERQQKPAQATAYFNSVMEQDLVLEARKKVVALALLNGQTETALTTLQKLRQDFSVFAPETFVMQADILWQQNRPDDALRLLTQAARQYPDNELLLFARAQRLDDQQDYIIKRALLNHLQALDPNNISYQLSYAQLLLANEPNSQQGLTLAKAITQIRYDDPRYDNTLHLQALNVLASNALANHQYQQVIDYLQIPYDVLPTLASGTLLLRAYQGLGDHKHVETLLADLQQRFSFGQHNINDRIQLY